MFIQGSRMAGKPINSMGVQHQTRPVLQGGGPASPNVRNFYRDYAGLQAASLKNRMTVPVYDVANRIDRNNKVLTQHINLMENNMQKRASYKKAYQLYKRAYSWGEFKADAGKAWDATKSGATKAWNDFNAYADENDWVRPVTYGLGGAGVGLGLGFLTKSPLLRALLALVGGGLGAWGGMKHNQFNADAANRQQRAWESSQANQSLRHQADAWIAQSDKSMGEWDKAQAKAVQNEDIRRGENYAAQQAKAQLQQISNRIHQQNMAQVARRQAYSKAGAGKGGGTVVLPQGVEAISPQQLARKRHVLSEMQRVKNQGLSPQEKLNWMYQEKGQIPSWEETQAKLKQKPITGTGVQYPGKFQVTGKNQVKRKAQLMRRFMRLRDASTAQKELLSRTRN